MSGVKKFVENIHQQRGFGTGFVVKLQRWGLCESPHTPRHLLRTFAAVAHTVKWITLRIKYLVFVQVLAWFLHCSFVQANHNGDK
jgi:hypothetical protein